MALRPDLLDDRLRELDFDEEPSRVEVVFPGIVDDTHQIATFGVCVGQPGV
jgi:hypothetical protein